MKLFSRKDERKKKAAARKLHKLQKFLEKSASAGLADVSREMKALGAEYEDLLAQTEAIIPDLDGEITDRKAQGEDTTSLEQSRRELLQGIEEMRKALAGVLIILKVTNN